MTGDKARVLRADLHLHSYHSGHAGQLRFLRARDCYSEPDAVYAAAKARGMDVVTITDHDSVEGCL
jgi:predicted metal-dependent phosphoesterase TrpH